MLIPTFYVLICIQEIIQFLLFSLYYISDKHEIHHLILIALVSAFSVYFTDIQPQYKQFF